jgi:hypothetical protein
LNQICPSSWSNGTVAMNLSLGPHALVSVCAAIMSPLSLALSVKPASIERGRQ